MSIRWVILLGLTGANVPGQSLESFTSLVRPGETFFSGDWSVRGEMPGAGMRQAAGSFEISGGTNNSRSAVDVYAARAGAYFSIGSNRFLEVSVMPLAGNRAGSFRVFLIDGAGRNASATFLAADFTTAGFRPVVEPLSFAPGFDPAAIERIRISGDAPRGADAFAFAFDHIAAVPAGPLVDGALRNFSILSPGLTSQNVAIVGFAVGGSAGKPVLVRGAGPALTAFGVAGALADPELQVFRGGAVVAANDNWGGDAASEAVFRRAGAFAFAAASRDAALATTLAPGSYTAQLSPVGAGTGTALLELYDLDEAPAYPRQRFTNVAARGTVGAGQPPLNAGFVIDGRMPRRFLLRVAGPALAGVGVASGFLADPRLRLTRQAGGSELLVQENDNWETGNERLRVSEAAAQAGAFPFAAGSRDAALVVTLPPGAYVAQAIAPAGQGGLALLEIYEVPP